MHLLSKDGVIHIPKTDGEKATKLLPSVTAPLSFSKNALEDEWGEEETAFTS